MVETGRIAAWMAAAVAAVTRRLMTEAPRQFIMALTTKSFPVKSASFGGVATCYIQPVCGQRHIFP